MDTACSEQDIARIVCTLLFIDVSLLVNRCNLNNIRRSMKSSFTFCRTAEVTHSTYTMSTDILNCVTAFSVMLLCSTIQRSSDLISVSAILKNNPFIYGSADEAVRMTIQNTRSFRVQETNTIP